MMRRYMIIAALMVLGSLPLTRITAQIRLVAPDSMVVSMNETKATPTIVDRINRIEPGKGYVRVIQDNEVANRIGRPVSTLDDGASRQVEIDGWRIQVFAGNNQRLSKEEAFRKEVDVKSVFPELATYVRWTAPFWRLRVGDFQTFRDASNMLDRLKRAFPSYGREMSIVKEKILVDRE